MNEATDVSAEPVRDSIFVPGRGEFSLLRWGDDTDLPLLIFSHATGFNAQTYTSLLAPLTDQFRIIALDQRGHGLSTASKDLSDLKGWDTYRDDLVGVLELLGEPAFLSGHSMGGTVSLLAAAEVPGLVRAMLLLDPVMIPSKAAWVIALRSWLNWPIQSPLSKGAARRRATFDSREAMFESYQGRGAFTTWPDAFIQDYIAGGTTLDEAGRATLTCAPAWESKTFTMASHQIWRRIQKVQCPTRILFAETGSTLRIGAADTIRTRQPDWPMEMVEGSTHFLPMEHPDLVRDALRGLAT